MCVTEGAVHAIKEWCEKTECPCAKRMVCCCCLIFILHSFFSSCAWARYVWRLNTSCRSYSALHAWMMLPYSNCFLLRPFGCEKLLPRSWARHCDLLPRCATPPRAFHISLDSALVAAVYAVPSMWMPEPFTSSFTSAVRVG